MAIDHPAVAALKEQFADVAFKGSNFRGQTQIIVPAANLFEVAEFLRDGPLGYDMLADVTCVDYLNFPGNPRDGRFGLVYVFNSIAVGSPRLTLRVFVDMPEPAVDSVVPLYAGAEWMEREVFDMFGVKFNGHPDLRRILTWDGFKAHPLRKDYPVTGRGEREDYPIMTRDSA
jgi:NADH-quinone oxidoreductase subunit C